MSSPPRFSWPLALPPAHLPWDSQGALSEFNNALSHLPAPSRFVGSVAPAPMQVDSYLVSLSPPPSPFLSPPPLSFLLPPPLAFESAKAARIHALRADRLENFTRSLRTRVRALEAAVEDLAERIAALDGRIADIELADDASDVWAGSGDGAFEPPSSAVSSPLSSVEIICDVPSPRRMPANGQDSFLGRRPRLDSPDPQVPKRLNFGVSLRVYFAKFVSLLLFMSSFIRLF